MSRVTLQGKRPNEIRTETFDFTSRLAASETISTAVVTTAVYSGEAGATGLQLYGAATISGQTVTQRMGGGAAGVVYYVTCKIVTSTGQTLEISAFLPIMPIGA